MGVLSQLEPKEVFENFEKICQIPHGSHHTQQISDFLAAFAAEHGLEVHQDESGNVIIRKDGTAGFEDAPAVMLQGHMDMVCEKEPGCPVDMLRDPLKLRVDNGIVSAEGTTLGGDDGIAVAYIMTLLASDTIPHPPLEAVITVDEEIGMLGASALDMSGLKAKYLLNMDSEDEGFFITGCAGGVVAVCHIPVKLEVYAGSETVIRVSGGKGGHSGIEINSGRANADYVLGRALKSFGEEFDFRLIKVSGGSKDNAIPPEAEAFLIAQKDARVPDMIAAIRKVNEQIKAEFGESDPAIKISIAVDQDIRVARGAEAFDQETTDHVVTALTKLPNGVQKMSADIPGLVQTSLNLGIMETTLSGQGSSGARMSINAGVKRGPRDEVTLTYGLRSSVEKEKEDLVHEMQQVMESVGGTLTLKGDYPAWEYQEHSPLRDLMVDEFKVQYGREPVIQVIHAGLECGLFAAGIPGLESVSFGPDMNDIHTPRETLDAASAKRTWDLVLGVLRRIPELEGNSIEGGKGMSKALVAYFSTGGVTGRVAKDLAEGAGADLFEIVPEKPYTAADLKFTNPFARCNKEKFGGKDVPIAEKVENMDQYDTVFIGFPIWYAGAPNVVKTFIKEYDFTGKKIAIFATSGGTGIGKSADKLQPLLGEGAQIVAAERFNAGAGAELLKSWAQRAL